jgi:DNA-binding transcriptional ArsR family regulator
MLRVHFTGLDLTRIRIASQPDPMWEIAFSLFRFRYSPPVFHRWRRDALRASSPATLHTLKPLVTGGCYPDFLTPADASHGIDTALEAVRATSHRRLRNELDRLGRQRGSLTQPFRLVRDGDREGLERVVGALRRHYDTAVRPYWDTVQAHVDADRAMRVRLLQEGGGEALLNSFGPMMRWEYPILACDFPADHDLYLDGRGVQLIPAYFSHGTPAGLYDSELPPVIVYPVGRDLVTGRSGKDVDDQHAALVALIGATRTYVLRLIEDGCTTGELARRAGVTSGAISQHTRVLREAGLILTSRAGKSVVHTLTPLGNALLRTL